MGHIKREIWGNLPFSLPPFVFFVLKFASALAILHSPSFANISHELKLDNFGLKLGQSWRQLDNIWPQCGFVGFQLGHFGPQFGHF